jgi:hypothetical protein
MVFREKREISHFWDRFSRAAFSIPEDLVSKLILLRFSAGSKSRSISNNLALPERSKSTGDPTGSVT